MTSRKVTKIVESTKNALRNESVSVSFQEAIGDLLDLVTVLVNQVGLNSSNSSKPPSSDPYRPRRTTRSLEAVFFIESWTSE